jgi:hypothetical protein
MTLVTSVVAYTDGCEDGKITFHPIYLADEKHSHCLTAKVYLPTIVCGRCRTGVEVLSSGSVSDIIGGV